MHILYLIMDAHFIEQFVLFLLLVASVISWFMIFQRYFVIKRAKNKLLNFENSFWSGIDLTQFYLKIRKEVSIDSGVENVFCAGFREYSRLDRITTDPEVLVSSIGRAMRIAINREEEHLNKHLSFLASVGSIAPYVGLFGTVSGIMSAFLAIAMSENTISISVLAPGIAQALIATAMGLLAAIPAVWAYNAFAAKNDFIINNYYTFVEEFSSVLNRKIRQKSPSTTDN